jgi:hypothetical protein
MPFPQSHLFSYIVRLCLIVYLISEFKILTYKYYYTWFLYSKSFFPVLLYAFKGNGNRCVRERGTIHLHINPQ